MNVALLLPSLGIMRMYMNNQSPKLRGTIRLCEWKFGWFRLGVENVTLVNSLYTLRRSRGLLNSGNVVTLCFRTGNRRKYTMYNTHLQVVDHNQIRNVANWPDHRVASTHDMYNCFSKLARKKGESIEMRRSVSSQCPETRAKICRVNAMLTYKICPY